MEWVTKDEIIQTGVIVNTCIRNKVNNDLNKSLRQFSFYVVQVGEICEGQHLFGPVVDSAYMQQGHGD